MALEFFFITFLQLLGIMFHVAQKINALDKINPDKSIKEIYGLFFENEWSSLTVSILVLVANLVTHAIIVIYIPDALDSMVTIPFTIVVVPVIIIVFIIALVLGYGGQRLAYKYLGKAEQYLSDKADKK